MEQDNMSAQAGVMSVVGIENDRHCMHSSLCVREFTPLCSCSGLSSCIGRSLGSRAAIHACIETEIERARICLSLPHTRICLYAFLCTRASRQQHKNICSHDVRIVTYSIRIAEIEEVYLCGLYAVDWYRRCAHEYHFHSALARASLRSRSSRAT